VCASNASRETVQPAVLVQLGTSSSQVYAPWHFSVELAFVGKLDKRAHFRPVLLLGLRQHAPKKTASLLIFGSKS